MTTAKRSNRIGTRRESSLHASLKQRYARAGDEIEAVVDGFQIDVVHRGVREGRAGYAAPVLIEVQTRSFSSLRRKLSALLAEYTVRLVHPIAQEKWIVKIGRDGEPISRRRSPKRGRVEHVFDELVSFPELIAHPNLTLEVVLTREEEVRCDDGRGSWRRGGWSIHDRRLLEVVDVVTFASAADFMRLIPADLAEPFTSRELAAAMNCDARIAQRAAYCLRRMGAIALVGKRGRAQAYARVRAPAQF